MIDVFTPPKATFCVALILPFLLKFLWKKLRPGLPLPPGPKGYPIIGNLFDINRLDPWVHYAELSKTYGDIVFLQSMGTKILVLSSYRRVTDLLEGRSAIYSGRPPWHMLNGMMGFDVYMTNMGYNSTWKRQRRLFHEYFSPTAISRFHPIMFGETSRLAGDLTSEPNKFSLHIRNYFARIIVKGIYGFDIKGGDDPYLKPVTESALGFIIAAVPGRFLVDLIPALKYVPKWLPGAGWKRWAEYIRETTWRAWNEPFDRVYEAWEKGTSASCIVTSMIDNLPLVDDEKREDEDFIARTTSGVAYIAGIDTTLGAAETFILLMALYPEVQKRAQAEIDDVVGLGNIPSIEDRDKLPYMTAILREVFRWQCEFPLGVPHATTADDIYDGYFIPKGTLVMVNACHLLKDPECYADPEEFLPERHIKDGQIEPNVLDPYSAAFGFGRRICPGRHLALDSLHVMMSLILSLFDIAPPKDEAGNSVLKWSFGTGILHQPNPFDCVITPRSEMHAQVIRNMNNDDI
ncbi:hypothetical protein D9611_011015 [Ephemerocybe angulata]|uniref:Cytochrome P450 n=1 Tax=Ephemerocybe angulata TaxID=980116 RepID=A0A8H5BBP0_9AGAR|nr:hypothetical protein D9611_011015 [Tulosesus angulatus]